MLITSDAIRGYIDTIILSHLDREDSYGYEINKTVKEKTKGNYELKEATLYTAFKRLEEQGCIQSYWGERDTGARRKYYRLTPLGKVELARQREDWKQAKEIISILIEEKNNE